MQGCVSSHTGKIYPSQVQLNQPNFKFVKSIQGVAQATYVLGIGGNMPMGLINEAKANMYQTYSFAKNQTITNITIDEKRLSFLYPILYVKTIIISADVIQFGEDLVNENINTNKKQENFENKNVLNEKKTENSLTDDEKIIKRLSETANLKEIIYSSINDVNVGDFVKFTSIYNEIIFAKIVSKVSNRIVKIELFPTPGTRITEEINFSKLKKVVFEN